MFSLHDIDAQIDNFTTAAQSIQESAEKVNDPILAAMLIGDAHGLCEAAAALKRMIERAVEFEAREAFR